MFSSKKKTRGTPKNWPNSSPEEVASLPYRKVSVGKEQQYRFCNNFVKTSKYEWYNFLPKFLFEEFNPTVKAANVYFLVIAFMQIVPAITNTNGMPTTLIPLLFVVIGDCVIMLREDLRRRAADKEANSSMTLRLNRARAQYESTIWSSIEVGDIVKVESRANVPADIVVLAVSEKYDPAQGICYVDTKSLDGETNLKLRQAHALTYNKIKTTADLINLNGIIEMEHPNKLIDNFSGAIEIPGMGREAILPNNVLLRGCVLRNVDWVVGIVVNTGHDTKIMRGITKTKPKTSFLESATTVEVKRIVLLLIAICLIGAIGGTAWNTAHKADEIWYLDIQDSSGKYFIIQFFYFFLLHATFIPVSLYISMALIRLFQSSFMNADLEMYYEKTDTPALVRTLPLNEELGQISHIFSDKTGTLTCNVMDFRKASINGVSYGLGITSIGKASWKLQGKEIPADMLRAEAKAKELSVPHVSFYDPSYERDMAENGVQARANAKFFRAISVCHDVIAEKVDGKVHLSASNPDDEALVCAAAHFGYEFKENRNNFAVLYHRPSKKEELVEILDVIEFSSQRKRMSVIARDPDGVIRLYCKGADSVMLDRLWPGQTEIVKATDAHMRSYSDEGLRCLMVAYADLDEVNYKHWHEQYKQATSDLYEIDKRKNGLKNRIDDLQDTIERNLTLLGCTGIEDCLQDGVPECIATLAAAGINLWVLTGDKEETAINIAVACNLVLPKQYMRQVIINRNSASTRKEMIAIFQAETELLEKDMAELGDKALPRALIIDGASLIIAMDDLTPHGTKHHLLEFSKRCKAVVGCRVSPDQKREMVNMIKTGVPGVRTLSIGDGANDVAMIQEAHVGVGIRGEEGLQAVNSSDYAIAQFRFLQVLLLKHGRRNYHRMSNLVCYMFYKNVLMSSCSFWFAWLNGFSGQKMFNEGSIQFYNLFYTAIPIVMYGVLDWDLPSDIVYKYPQLYKDGINNTLFTSRVFWTWILQGLCEAIICTYLPILALNNSDPQNGMYETFWQGGGLTFTAVVIFTNVKVGFLLNQVHIGLVFAFAYSFGMWIMVAFVLATLILLDFEWFGVFQRLLLNGSFWMGLLFLVALHVVKDLYLAIIRFYGYPTNSQILREKLLVDRLVDRWRRPGVEIELGHIVHPEHANNSY